MEGKKDKSIDKVLSKDERGVLFEMMDHPGWDVLKTINTVMTNDWMDQTSYMDLSAKSDDELIRFVRHRQGQIKGMRLVMDYLEKKRKDSLNTKVVRK